MAAEEGWWRTEQLVLTKRRDINERDEYTAERKAGYYLAARDEETANKQGTNKEIIILQTAGESSAMLQ